MKKISLRPFVLIACAAALTTLTGCAGGGGSTSAASSTYNANAATGGGSSSSSSTGTTTTPAVHFPSVSDYAAPGPYAVVRIENTGPGNAYTVFRPLPMGENGLRNPVITWGNGSGATPDDYKPLLTHMASHGFVIVASNSTDTGSGQEMIEGIDWLTAENTTPGSDYYQRLDMTHVAAMGHSQGGGGTLTAGMDSRFVTIVPIEPSLRKAADADLSQLHEPMLLLCGGQDSLVDATTICTNQIYNHVPNPTFFGVLDYADHFTPTGYTSNSDDGFVGPITEWMRAWLMDDTKAAAAFFQAPCELCGNVQWQVQSKGLSAATMASIQ